ncbi:MAG: DM13 domain-containing protein [Actinomycetota bacterium]
MATKVEDTRPSPPPPPDSAGTPWWAWVLRALPAVAFLATFGFFFVDKNEQARSVFRAGRGLLTVAALVGGYVVLAIVLRRLVRWTWVAPLALTAVILVLAAWIVRPYYVDETDNTKLVEGPVVDASDDEQPPTTDASPAPDVPDQPVRVATGALEGLAGHDASGTVDLIRNTDGTYVVRFSAFDIEGSPDPSVYLIEGNDQRSPGGSNLGGLRGNVGDASDYAVPADVQPGGGWTVLVWCGQFTVEIANASLSPA